VRAGAALLAGGLAIAAVTPALALKGHAADAWYVLAYGGVAGGIALTTLRLRRHYEAAIPSRPASVLACVIPLLIVMGLVKPTALTLEGLWRTVTRQRIASPNSASEYGLTAQLYRGLIWVRDHTNRCDVLAVNNHYSEPDDMAPDYLYYSAFTERRVFLESWHYAPPVKLGANPFPGRLALSNQAASGNPAALRELARDGVSYILIDKLHGSGSAGPPSTSRLVFSNSALDVYRLRAPAASASHRLPCGTVG
jgi:hypothetical protein